MPPKGNEGTNSPKKQQQNLQSSQDFDDILPYRPDSFYGLDVAEDDFWNAVPISQGKPETVILESEKSAALTLHNTQEEKAELSAVMVPSIVFDSIADLGDMVTSSTKVVSRRLLFIPRFFGALFSWALRGVRGHIAKSFKERKRRSKAERGMLRRELKGIGPYLKRAEGNPLNWLRRLWVVMSKLAENHKNSFLKLINVALPFGAAAVLLLVINHWNNQTFALEVSYRQKNVGYISSEAVFAEAEDLALERIVGADGNGSDSSLVPPMFALASVPVNKLNDSVTLSDRLVEDSGENLTNAVGIYINKEFLCSVKNRSDAESVFDKLLEPYRSNKSGVFVDFVEDIRYEEGLYPDDSKTMWDASRLAAKLSEQKQSQKTYTIKEGDTIWAIARENDLTEQELLNLNPKYKKEAMWPGEKMVISASVNYVQVKVMKTETRTVSIPFETVYTYDSTLWQNTTRTLSAGSKGKEKITEMVTYIDGQRTNVKEITRERVKEPVSARVAKGTKSLVVSSANTGSVTVSVTRSGFVWPASGCRTVSSPYGYRWGGFHTGVDLIRSGGSYGAAVLASLDGTVEYAGWSNGGYGYRVVINHGGGLKTTYSHMAAGSISVSTGRYVTAGTPVGRVGSTGYSTGPHLHFEVMVNGSYQNPMNYLR